MSEQPFMQEGKLRAWHTLEKKMVYFSVWELLQYYNDEGDYCRIADTDLFHFAREAEHLKLMYCIGYEDKRGHDIYVGDILQDLFNQRVEVVTFCDISNVISGFTLRSVGKRLLLGGFEVFAVSWLMDAEIVGNIYEMPVVEVTP